MDQRQYYAAVAAAAIDPADILDRGRAAGIALGTEPARTVDALVPRVLDRLALADDAQVIMTIVGGVPVGTYVETRTFELVVHGVDIARAIGRPYEGGAELIADATALAARIAVARGGGADVLVGLTGRGTMPRGLAL